MNREEILTKNREDNRGIDEREKTIRLEANKYAMLIGTWFGFLIVALEFIFADTIVLTLVSFSTMYLVFAVSSWVLAIKLKNKKTYISAMFESLVFVFCFTILLCILLKTSLLHINWFFINKF